MQEFMPLFIWTNRGTPRCRDCGGGLQYIPSNFFHSSTERMSPGYYHISLVVGLGSPLPGTVSFQ